MKLFVHTTTACIVCIVCLAFAPTASGQVAPGLYLVADGSTVLNTGGGFGVPYTGTLRGELSIVLDSSTGSAEIVSESLGESRDGGPFQPLRTFCSPLLTDLVGTIQDPDTVIFVQPPDDPVGEVDLVLTSTGGGRLQLDGSIGSTCPDDFAYVLDAVELLPGRQPPPAIPGSGFAGTAILTVALCTIGVLRLLSAGG